MSSVDQSSCFSLPLSSPVEMSLLSFTLHAPHSLDQSVRVDSVSPVTACVILIESIESEFFKRNKLLSRCWLQGTATATDVEKKENQATISSYARAALQGGFSC